VEDARLGESRDSEDLVADHGDLLGEEGGNIPADHLAHDGLDGRLRDGARRDVGAVTHHRDGVAQVEDLVEAVRDEEQRAALIAQAAGDGEQALDLDAAEGCGRFVHDENAGVE
jgi:hypothetical protein